MAKPIRTAGAASASEQAWRSADATLRPPTTAEAEQIETAEHIRTAAPTAATAGAASASEQAWRSADVTLRPPTMAEAEQNEMV
ncbi:MAG: hypothetical protein ACE37B_07435 [Ilumatobacter sp.]|uniref:hypothetical protein n=1 Tax=Ilumatobacter sp. TaxID=1967498 RepID=UPI00391BCAD4